MIRTLFLALLFGTIAFCEEPVKAKKPKTPGFGFVKGPAEGLVLGDYNLFPQDKIIYGVKRYGGGFSRLRIGEGFGISLSSQSGFFLFDPAEFPLVIAMEPINGSIVYDNHGERESYYQWLPMVGGGIRLPYGSKCYMLIAARYGAALGNLGKKGRKIETSMSKGGSFYFNDDNNGIGITYTKFGKKSLQTVDVFTRNLGIRYERTEGLRDEKSILFIFRLMDL